MQNTNYRMAYGNDHACGLFIQIWHRGKDDEDPIIDKDQSGFNGATVLSVSDLVSIAEDYGFDIHHECEDEEIEYD